MSSDFVLDTFTRTGSLAVGVGEIGASWNSFLGTDLTWCHLTGTGVVSHVGTQNGYASGIPLTANYGVESIFTINTSLSSNFEQHIYSRLDPNYWTGTFFTTLAAKAVYQSLDGTIYYSVSGPSGNIFLDLGPGAGPAGAGTRTMKLELEGMSLRIYFDGALKTTRDITSTGLTGAGFAGFGIYDVTYPSGPLGGGSNRLDNFRAYSIDPPPVFWTERIKTSEVVS